MESLESLKLLELLAIGMIAGGIIGFFFGFKAGQMTTLKKLRLLTDADQPKQDQPKQEQLDP